MLLNFRNFNHVDNQAYKSTQVSYNIRQLTSAKNILEHKLPNNQGTYYIMLSVYMYYYNVKKDICAFSSRLINTRKVCNELITSKLPLIVREFLLDLQRQLLQYILQLLSRHGLLQLTIQIHRTTILMLQSMKNTMQLCKVNRQKSIPMVIDKNNYKV